MLILVWYYLYLSHASLPANNNLWGVIVWRCCQSLMWVRGFGLFLQHAGVIICRSIGDGCINNVAAICCHPSSGTMGRLSRLAGVFDVLGSTSTCLRWRTGHQVRKRRSSRHRRRKQQSTSSIYLNPSGLSANRRRAVDDKEGHLIYDDGDILHSRCIQTFVYLLIRWRCFWHSLLGQLIKSYH